MHGGRRPRGASAAASRADAAAGDARRAARVHSEAHLDGDRRDAGPRGHRSIPTPITSPDIARRRAARRRRGGGRRSKHRAVARRRARSRWCGRPAIMPSATSDGLLLLQQRRGRGGACARAAALERVADRGLRRPPRQRDAVDVLRRSARAVRLDPPVSVLSGNRRRRRDVGARNGRGLHRERAAGGRRDRRRLRARSSRRWSCRCSTSSRRTCS